MAIGGPEFSPLATRIGGFGSTFLVLCLCSSNFSWINLTRWSIETPSSSPKYPPISEAIADERQEIVFSAKNLKRLEYFL